MRLRVTQSLFSNKITLQIQILIRPSVLCWYFIIFINFVTVTFIGWLTKWDTGFMLNVTFTAWWKWSRLQNACFDVPVSHIVGNNMTIHLVCQFLCSESERQMLYHMSVEQYLWNTLFMPTKRGTPLWQECDSYANLKGNENPYLIGIPLLYGKPLLFEKLNSFEFWIENLCCPNRLNISLNE